MSDDRKERGGVRGGLGGGVGVRFSYLLIANPELAKKL